MDADGEKAGGVVGVQVEKKDDDEEKSRRSHLAAQLRRQALVVCCPFCRQFRDRVRLPNWQFRLAQLVLFPWLLLPFVSGACFVQVVVRSSL